MRKKLIVFNLLLLIIIIFIGLQSFQLFQKKNLNIILISVDTLRADHMGVYGYSKNTTPNLDNFAKKAKTFTNLRTVVPMTWPSFTALFTGIEPFNTRISTNGNTNINPTTITLMSLLKNKGYSTTAFTSNVANLNDQFKEFNFYNNKSFYNDENGVERYRINTANGSRKIVTDASSWLEKNSNKKFFLWVHLMDPHAPYFPSKNFKCKFGDKLCNKLISKPVEQIDIMRAEYQMCQQNVPAKRIEEMKTLYDGGIAEADYYIGKLLDKIKSLGLDKNSIIVFYSDHGEGFDHNYYFNHRHVLYDSAVKIPLLIFNPLNPSGSKSNVMIQNTDIMPTLLNLVGINTDMLNIDGKNFGTGRNYSYFVNNNWTKYAITDGKYKYIYSLPTSCLLNNQLEELYDLKKDPSELNNIYSKNTEITAKLRQKLLLYLSKYNLPPLVNSKNASLPNNYEVGEDPKIDPNAENIRSLGY